MIRANRSLEPTHDLGNRVDFLGQSVEGVKESEETKDGDCRKAGRVLAVEGESVHGRAPVLTKHCEEEKRNGRVEAKSVMSVLHYDRRYCLLSNENSTSIDLRARIMRLSESVTKASLSEGGRRRKESQDDSVANAKSRLDRRRKSYRGNIKQAPTARMSFPKTADHSW